MHDERTKLGRQLPRKGLSSRVKLTGLLLTLTLLAGCATAETVTSNAAVCSGWKKLGYSSKHDTAKTVQGIRAHNLFGIRRRCWTAQDKPS